MDKLYKWLDENSKVRKFEIWQDDDSGFVRLVEKLPPGTRPESNVVTAKLAAHTGAGLNAAMEQALFRWSNGDFD